MPARFHEFRLIINDHGDDYFDGSDDSAVMRRYELLPSKYSQYTKQP